MLYFTLKVFLFLIIFLFLVIFDVDSLYRKTKLILKKKLVDGELSSEAQSRVLDLLSHSFNETSNQMTKFLEEANAITLNSKDSYFLIWSVFFFSY